MCTGGRKVLEWWGKRLCWRVTKDAMRGEVLKLFVRCSCCGVNWEKWDERKFCVCSESAILYLKGSHSLEDQWVREAGLQVA